MEADPDEEVLERIQTRLTTLGLSESGAAKAAGLGASAIRNIREGKSRSPRLKTLRQLAITLETSPEWLAFGRGGNAIVEAVRFPPPTEGLPVAGEVAAGNWLGIDEIVDVPRHRPVPIAFEPRWPKAAQFGLVVRGTSINRVADDGDVLHCIDCDITGLQPTSGDLVIVERIDGARRERTAKRYRIGDSGMATLRADSEDELWLSDEIELPLRITSYQPTEGVRLEIKAVVIGAYRSMLRGRP